MYVYIVITVQPHISFLLYYVYTYMYLCNDEHSCVISTLLKREIHLQPAFFPNCVAFCVQYMWLGLTEIQWSLKGQVYIISLHSVDISSGRDSADEKATSGFHLDIDSRDGKFCFCRIWDGRL